MTSLVTLASSLFLTDRCHEQICHPHPTGNAHIKDGRGTLLLFLQSAFLQVHSQFKQICGFLILPNLLLSSSLPASSPVFQTSVRSTYYFLWSGRGWHTSVSNSYSGGWLGGTDHTSVRPTSLYGPKRWYLQYYRLSFPRPYVSIIIGRICTFYLSITIQVPDHVRKRRDQWKVHQSQNWPSEIYSPTSASYILT